MLASPHLLVAATEASLLPFLQPTIFLNSTKCIVFSRVDTRLTSDTFYSQRAVTDRPRLPKVQYLMQVDMYILYTRIQCILTPVHRPMTRTPSHLRGTFTSRHKLFTGVFFNQPPLLAFILMLLQRCTRTSHIAGPPISRAICCQLVFYLFISGQARGIVYRDVTYACRRKTRKSNRIRHASSSRSTSLQPLNPHPSRSYGSI